MELLLFLLSALSVSWTNGAVLEVVNEWGVFDFDAPLGHPTSSYKPGQTPMTSIEVGLDRIFIAVPRLFSGIPATLAAIPRNKHGGLGELSPKLQAYPGWEWHAWAAGGGQGTGGDNCTGIVSVFRMRLDKCNRLWVLDNGVLDTFETFTVLCRPKILIFDLNTDQLLKRVEVPQELLRRNSLLTNLVLDDHQQHGGYRQTCDDGLIAYMSDSSSPVVIVYDVSQDRMWRISHPYMYPDPNHGTYTVQGESFTLMDGILGMALTPPGVNPQRLFFQPFASDRIFSIQTSNILRGPISGDDAELPVRVEGTKSSQAAGMIFDPRDGSLYFSPVSEMAVVSWVPGAKDPRIVAYDPELLQYVLDFRSATLDNNNIWLISTKLHKFVKKTVNPSVPHLRIIRIIDENSYLNNTLYY